MSYNCARPITLMQPERLVFPPGWVGHIPFAFWIVEATRPRCFVELGTHTGNSFGAFVQAASSLSLTGRFFAVDHWRGDDHAGNYEEDVYQEVRRYFDGKYSNIAELLRMNFDEAALQFQDSSVDLLHIDGFHTYEAVKHDFETWLPKMSERGVVLLHDTHVRERGFGVYRLMEELSQRYPAFEFTHSHGLGVVQTGSQAPDAVKGLVGGEPDENGILAADYFARLGTAVMGEAYAKILLGAAAEGLSIEAALGQASLHMQEIEAQNRYLHEEHGRLVAEKDRLAQDNNLVHAEKDRLAQENELLRAEKDRVADDARLVYAEKDRLAAEHRLQEGMLAVASKYLADSADAPNAPIQRRVSEILTVGARQLRESSPVFDPDYYLASNPDVAASGMDPLVHYLAFGLPEGRSPTPPGEDMASEQISQEAERTPE